MAREIAALIRVGPYRLMRRPDQILHDIYFDTGDRTLRSHKLALRLRRVSDRPRLTLKGPSRATSGVGIKREEIEMPWSDAGLGRMIKELGRRHVPLSQSARAPSRSTPVKTLTSLGLDQKQDRRSRRTVRQIVSARDTKRVLAELAIDAVEFRFPSQRVHLHEIEIEAKAPQGSRVISAVAKHLRAQYGSALRQWRFSKLATGQAIEKLLSSKILHAHLDTRGNLKPSAFSLIARSAELV